MGETKNSVRRTANYLPGGEMWRHVPKRDQHGRRCTDFMMLLPSLRSGEPIHHQHALSVVDQISSEYGERLIYADLNLKLNLLWISVAGQPGLCREIAWAIQDAIPSALLVGNYFGERPCKRGPVSRLLGWLRPHALPAR